MLPAASSSSERVAQRIRLTAIKMLARCERSAAELKRKLSLKFPQQDHLIELQLRRLQDESLQSDERFVEYFVRYRLQRGQGPVKISYDLRNYGIDQELIELALQPLQQQWPSLALKVIEKKYAGRELSDAKSKAQAMRFLFQRGFSQEHSYAALQQWQQE